MNDVKPNHALCQIRIRSSQFSPEDQLRRSCTLRRIAAQRSWTAMSHFQPNLSRPMPACSTTTWRRFQFPRPSHTPRVSERGWCSADLQAQSYGAEAAVESTHSDIIQGLYVCFVFCVLRNTTQQGIILATQPRLCTWNARSS